MPEVKSNCPPTGPFKEAVCIDAGRVYDSCCDRDCLENLPCFFSPRDKALIDDALSVKVKSAEVIDVFIDVEPVHLNNGFYACDITFFFLVKLDVFCAPHSKPITVCGVCSADKKVILYGSEGEVKVFSNELTLDDASDRQSPEVNNLPKCVVSCVDPVALSAKIVEKCPCHCACRCIPKKVCGLLGTDSAFIPEEGDKTVMVTLGLFSIVQLIRNIQMLIPVYDFCIPEKECNNATDTPCELFSKIKFPLDNFFPPRPCQLDECGCARGCSCEE